MFWHRQFNRRLLILTQVVCTLREEQKDSSMGIIDTITTLKNAIITEDEKAITLLAQLSASLKDISAQLSAALANAADPVAIQAVVDEINAETAKLDAAVVADTPPTP